MSKLKECQNFDKDRNVELAYNCSDRESWCEDSSWYGATQGQCSKDKLLDDVENQEAIVKAPEVFIIHNARTEGKFVFQCLTVVSAIQTHVSDCLVDIDHGLDHVSI